MDYIIVRFLNNLLGKFFYLDVIVIFFADFIIFFIPFFIILVYLLKHKNLKLIFFKIIIGVFVAGFINYIIAEIIQRLRPFVLYEDIVQSSHFFSILPTDFSFPSDHTAIAFVMAFLVYYQWKNFGKILIIISFLIGISRVVIGVHFLTDILFGIIIAFIISLFINKIIVFKNTTNKSN